MSFKALCLFLMGIGIYRARFVTPAPGELIVQLPGWTPASARRAAKAEAFLAMLKPVGVIYKYERLAWWRCRFTSFQLVKSYL